MIVERLSDYYWRLGSLSVNLFLADHTDIDLVRKCCMCKTACHTKAFWEIASISCTAWQSFVCDKCYFIFVFLKALKFEKTGSTVKW